jgi:ubiquinone/menaquinone biosynthesis C-methylase UbiE
VTGPTTERVRAYYDQSANGYDSSIRLFERLLLADGRAWAASRARGDVLEIGIGTGRNLEFYPEATRLVGIDLSPGMLAIARRRAQDLGRAVDLRQGDAESLAFADAAFDTVVCTLVLCSVPDDRRVLAEVGRVLKRGGRVVLVEHVRSRVTPVRIVQQLLEPVMLRLENDHLLRDPVDHLPAYGFEIETCERTKWGIVERVIAHKTDPVAFPPRSSAGDHLASQPSASCQVTGGC